MELITQKIAFRAEIMRDALFKLHGAAIPALMFAVFALLVTTNPSLFIRGDGFSERLIADSLQRYSQVGDDDVGAFMVAFSEWHIAYVQQILDQHDVRGAYPYISNYGGQYAIGRFLIDTFGFSGSFAHKLIRVFAILGMALVLSLIFIAIWRDFGVPHAVAVLGAFLLSGLFLVRSASAYWLIFLNFLPFAATLFLYPYARRVWDFALLLALVLIFVLVKSLTGYEYLSSITISAMVPVLYHELKESGDTKKALANIVLRVFAIGAACVIGFGLALTLHIYKMSEFFGGLNDGLRAIRLIVSYSALEDESGIGGSAPGVMDVVNQWLMTFLAYNFHINIILLTTIYWIALMAIVGVRKQHIHKRLRNYFGSALFGATVFAFVATVSWSVLMIRHSFFHAHINWLQNYLCAYIFLIISLVEVGWTRNNANEAVRHERAAH